MGKSIEIIAKSSGKLCVKGKVTLLDEDGKELKGSGEKGITLCGCGASREWPICDGSHKDCKLPHRKK